MPTNPAPAGARSLATLFNTGALGGRTDCELLECFRSDRGAAGQESFRVLVERHGPMVLGLCHSLVHDTHEAEDAFQATFLVLVSKAGTIERTDTIAPWLYGVASKVARRASHRFLLRRQRELPATNEIPRRESQSPTPAVDDGMIHEEINRLPESIRAPLLLCCIQGLSYDVAARQLGVKEPTLRGRLHRARKRLASRLHARGVPSALLGRQGPDMLLPLPALPLPLVESTVQFSTRWPSVAGLLGVDSGIPGSILNLAQGVASSMLIQTIKVSAAVVLFSAAVLGTGVLAQQTRRGAGDALIQLAARTATQDRPEPPVVSKAEQTRQASVKQARARQREGLAKRIREKLDQRIDAEFPQGTTLSGILKHVKDKTTDASFTGIPIYVSPDGLNEAKTDLMTKVVVNAHQEPVRAVLQKALHGTGLSFMVSDDGFLKIDSRTTNLEARVDQIESKIDRILDGLARTERPR